MELKEGKMTLRELSQWFGLSPDSISKSKPNVKEKKFKLLKTFANYYCELVINRLGYMPDKRTQLIDTNDFN